VSDVKKSLRECVYITYRKNVTLQKIYRNTGRTDGMKDYKFMLNE